MKPPMAEPEAAKAEFTITVVQSVSRSLASGSAPAGQENRALCSSDLQS